MDQLHHGHGGDMRRPPPALRAVQKPPAKPWRGGSVAPAPAPPKVYRVEPREFRELVQRLTGAPAARRQQQQQVVVAPAQPVAVRAGGEDLYSAAAAAPWCSFPPLGHAASMDAHHGNGALI